MPRTWKPQVGASVIMSTNETADITITIKIEVSL